MKDSKEQGGVNDFLIFTNLLCKNTVAPTLQISQITERLPTSPCSTLNIPLLCFQNCGDAVLALWDKTYSLLHIS